MNNSSAFFFLTFLVSIFSNLLVAGELYTEPPILIKEIELQRQFEVKKAKEQAAQEAEQKRIAKENEKMQAIREAEQKRIAKEKEQAAQEAEQKRIASEKRNADLPLQNQQEKKASFSNSQICKASIATIMGRDPKIMYTQVKDDVIYLSYTRQADESNWGYRCKIEGNKVIWSSDTGNWRTKSTDSQIKFTLNNDALKIEEYLSGELVGQESFTVDKLNN